MTCEEAGLTSQSAMAAYRSQEKQHFQEENRSRKVLRLLLVRHGETTANADGICQGQSMDRSYCLTMLGIAQARAAGRVLPSYVSPMPFWRIIGSDLPRARQTLSLLLLPKQIGDGSTDIITSEGCFPAPEYSPLVREFRLGLREGQARAMPMKQLREDWRRIHGMEETPPTPERTRDVVKRGWDFLHLLVSDALAEMLDPRQAHDAIGVPSASTLLASSDTHNVMDDEFSAIESAEQQEPKVVLVVSHGGFIRMFLQHVCGFKNVDIINNTSFSTIDVFVKLDAKANEASPKDLKFEAVALNDTAHLGEASHGARSPNLMSQSRW